MRVLFRHAATLTYSALVMLGLGFIQADAQELLKINNSVWNALTEPEREILRSRYMVDVVGSEFGLIIDVQMANESTLGNNIGSTIGGAYGSAAYIDNAFKGSGSYSASSHLGSALLGAMIGSAMDQPARRQFRVRYTIRDINGNILTQDRVSDQPFSVPAGSCINVTTLKIMPSSVCDSSVIAVRERYLQSHTIAPSSPASTKTSEKPSQRTKPNDHTHIVRCKLGTAGVVNVSFDKCQAAQGDIIK